RTQGRRSPAATANRAVPAATDGRSSQAGYQLDQLLAATFVRPLSPQTPPASAAGPSSQEARGPAGPSPPRTPARSPPTAARGHPLQTHYLPPLRQAPDRQRPRPPAASGG